MKFESLFCVPLALAIIAGVVLMPQVSLGAAPEAAISDVSADAAVQVDGDTCCDSDQDSNQESEDSDTPSDRCPGPCVPGNCPDDCPCECPCSISIVRTAPMMTGLIETLLLPETCSSIVLRPVALPVPVVLSVPVQPPIS